MSFEEVLKRNVELSCELTMNEVDWSKPHDHKMVLVGGGPSLLDHVEDIRKEAQEGAFILTTNGTHDFLLDKGIKPNFCIFVDAHPHLYRLFKPQKGVVYLVASQCHLGMFIKLEGFTAIRWHCDNGSGWEAKAVPEGSIMILGGSTAILRAPFLAYVMGFRKFKYYGLDSCFRGDLEHAYDQAKVDARLTVTFRDRDFESNYQMACQARDFIVNYKRMTSNGCTCEVVGDGLIPYIYECWKDQEPNTSEIKVGNYQLHRA